MADDKPGSDPSPAEDLRALAARIGDGALAFIEERLHLAQEEWRDEIRKRQADLVRLSVGIALGLVGVQLLVAALILILSPLAPAWALCLGGGFVLLAAGGGLVWWQVRPTAPDPPVFEHTLEELRKDLQWISGRG